MIIYHSIVHLSKFAKVLSVELPVRPPHLRRTRNKRKAENRLTKRPFGGWNRCREATATGGACDNGDRMALKDGRRS